jgi:uncharacterized protein (DUF4415 family)
MVTYTPQTLPPLTKAARARLKALAARPDGGIDTSDIPEMTDEQWKHARRGHFYRPRKRQITARVDADVLDWLKAQGKGYQSRINAILRREMLTSVKSCQVTRFANVDRAPRPASASRWKPPAPAGPPAIA